MCQLRNELEDIRRALHVLRERAARNEEIPREGEIPRDSALQRQAREVEEMRRGWAQEQEENPQVLGEMRRAPGEEEARGRAMRERRDSMVLEQSQSVWVAVGHGQDGGVAGGQEAEKDAPVEEDEYEDMDIVEWMEVAERVGELEGNAEIASEEDGDEDEASRGPEDMELESH